jgi:hypothetical protein
MLRVTAFSSAAVCGWFTNSSQPRGRSIGQAESSGASAWPQYDQKMPIVLDGKALEPTLVEMPMSHRVVGVFPTLGVGQRQPAEEAGQFRIPLWPEHSRRAGTNGWTS